MKAVLLVLAALVLGAPAVQAGGINLTWGSGCWQDNPSTLLAFACDSNSGSAIMTASFAFDRGPHYFSGFAFAAQLDLQSDSSVLPDWWQLTTPGGCRQGAFNGSADFTGASGGCVDVWQGHAYVRYATWRTSLFPGGMIPPPPNRVVFWLDIWTDEVIPDVRRGVEYYGFKVTVDYQKSVGPGACGGCSTPVTIVLNEISTGWEHGWHLTNPLANTCVRWQAGGGTPCAATPALSPTWGQLKSLYR